MKIPVLRDRASMLAKTRAFFEKRGVLEVDCPVLHKTADIAAHIDLITALYNQKETCYLSPSPEYGMKKLLSEGSGDIYQLSHVFRDGESSRKHNPEFTLIEWYRIGMSFEELIAETMELIELFLGKLPRTLIPYRQAFIQYAGIDYLKMSPQDLLDYMKKNKIETYPGIEKEDKDALLNLIISTIEPQLGTEGLCALVHYPATQAALSKTRDLGEEKVAERFEIYYKGLELCNGYNELTNPIEQKERILEANLQRVKNGKQALPIDEAFLAALEKGVPACCGVAVGFDRLMMLRHQTDEIGDVLPFVWN